MSGPNTKGLFIYSSISNMFRPIWQSSGCCKCRKRKHTCIQDWDIKTSHVWL